MKRAALALLLVACGGSSASPTEPAPSAPSAHFPYRREATAHADPTTPGTLAATALCDLGDTVLFGGCSMSSRYAEDRILGEEPHYATGAPDGWHCIAATNLSATSTSLVASVECEAN